MSTADRFERLERLDAELDALARRVFYVVFGDRVGAAVFLGALLFFALYWRVEFLSTDNYMHVNTLLSVSDGGLAIDRFVYGPPSGETPAIHYFRGQVYGDNYGLILSSLPALYVFRAVSFAVDLRIALAGLWSLGLLGVVVLVRSRTSRPAVVTVVGSALALLVFVGNVAVASGPIDPYWQPLLALQTTSMVFAALIAVLLYRLASDLYGRRVGTAAGLATALATPVAFWAVVPKRHSATAFFAVLALYAFYRSRAGTTVREETTFRAVAYASVGLCTWFHSAEALILLVALAPVDLLTARHNRPTQLVVVGVAFAVSMLPFLVTNYAITGNPAQPLRLLPSYTGQPLAADPGASSTAAGSGGAATSGGGTAAPSTAGDGATSGTTTGDATPSGGSPASQGESPVSGRGVVGPFAARVVALLAAVVGVSTESFATVVDGVDYFQSRLVGSMRVVTDTDRLTEVFLRSGYRPSLRPRQDRAVNLSVLESMPLLGALVAVPVLAVRRTSRARLREFARRPRSLSPVAATDLLALVYVAVLVVFYLRSLPLHHMLTVRYLHPLYPFGMYALLRLPAVRHVVEGHGALLWRSYVGSVVVGTAAYLGALAAFETVQGEAVQLYGVCAFAVGVAVAVWALVSSLRGPSGRAATRLQQVGTVVLGVAAAAMTVYLLVAGVVLFSVEGDFVLPVSRAVGDALVGVNPFR